MTLHQLIVFEAVARHLNLTRAAVELHISQPSVSQQLKLLEEEFGLKFHVRLAQGIKLTEEGQALLNPVRRILLLAKTLPESFRGEMIQRNVRSLIVGGSYSAAAACLHRVLARFSKIQPEVRVTLRTHDSKTIEQLVARSEVEIGLITKPSYSQQVTTELFGEEEMLLIASVNHRLAMKKTVTLNDLEDVPLVVRVEERILEQLKQLGLKLKVAFQCETPEALKAAVLAGTGVGILNRSCVTDDSRHGSLKIIKIPGLRMSINFFLIYPKDKPLSSSAHVFLVLLRRTSHVHGHDNGVTWRPSL